MDANVTKYKKFIGIKEMTSCQILVLYERRVSTGF